jgi:hypothetical protein
VASPTAKTCDRYRPTHRHSLVQVKISLNEYLDNTDQLRLEARHFVYAQEVSRFPREVARRGSAWLPLPRCRRGHRQRGSNQASATCWQTRASSSRHNNEVLTVLAGHQRIRVADPASVRRYTRIGVDLKSCHGRRFRLQKCRCRRRARGGNGDGWIPSTWSSRPATPLMSAGVPVTTLSAGVPRPLQELITRGRTLVKRTRRRLRPTSIDPLIGPRISQPHQLPRRVVSRVVIGNRRIQSPPPPSYQRVR